MIGVIIMFRNFTPHDVTLVETTGTRTFPSEGVARVATTSEVIDVHDGVAIMATEFGDVTGLPAREPGVYIVVSRLVIQAAPDRGDLVAPDDLVRDEGGRITGCRRFSR